MGPKYEFTDETMNHDGYTLHRIRRLSDGKIGGWIEKEENLSQEGNCWVDDNAKVYEDAKVYGDAQVYDNDTKVCRNARIYDNAKVCWGAEIYGNVRIYDNARIAGGNINGNAEVYGYATIYSWATIFGNAKVYGHAVVCNHAHVYGDAQIYEDAYVYHEAEVKGVAKVHGYAKIGGMMEIIDGEYTSGNICIDGDLSNDSSKEVVKDFIYKVDDSNKITAQTKYNSIDEFFDEPITNDINLDTLVICTVDTKEPLIKLQKVNNDGDNAFKYIVEITSENGDDFIVRSTIKTQEQLNQKLEQTVEALKQYPEFSKYTDDLEDCL